MSENSIEAQPKYFVADSWVLTNYTRGPRANNFSNLINELELTIAVDTFTLTEIYNPDWRRIPFIGRTRNVSEFLVDHPTVLINPQELLLSEIRSYPNIPLTLPHSFDFASQHWSIRDYLIKGLFRRDKDLTHLGMDLEVWSQDYMKTKDSWPSNVRAIIEDATSKGILAKHKDGSIDIGESDKEAFLRYLDQRFLRINFHRNAPHDEFGNLSKNVEDLYRGATSKLPALRLTSLVFWHAYVQIDKAFIMPSRGSDIADIYRAALVPYSEYFTADKAMERVLSHAVEDFPQPASILGPSALENVLDQFSPEPGDLLMY
ncbi:MAG: hypothetical protein C5S38_05735 [Candidatus Methanophagaceae archaeon]|nr:MAG: hypothetical protein C5S38_05735 [Methanophagales archaeon]KAF5435378.1 hypothetical protein C5S36_03290 [Methanophagales archaeon]